MVKISMTDVGTIPAILQSLGVVERYAWRSWSSWFDRSPFWSQVSPQAFPLVLFELTTIAESFRIIMTSYLLTGLLLLSS